MTPPSERLEARWRALRQQPAFQASLVFAAAAWFVLQVADVLGLPLGLVRALASLLLVVFVALTAFALARAWAGTRTPSGPRRRGRLAMAFALGLVVVGTAFWWLRPRLARAAVVPGADVIAVLPFSTTGADAEDLSEGLVDLLARNLDGVGGIRVIDPRTALYRWRRSGGDALDVTAALDVGRTLGAGSILTGTAVAVGKELRLSADLIGVDGKSLARTEATGVVDSVLPLVDRMSTDMLRRIWRGREPWPAFRLSAVTTESPEALRAYLRGERFFRTSEWDSAAASFEEAIHDDSTFALAFVRLGTSYGWTEFLGAQRSTEYAEAAWRFADRLPARERSLVAANRLHQRGDITALDSLESFVSAYPDDADGWELLGDAELHSLVVSGRSLASPLEAFDRAIALDSSAAPAYMHPLDLTLLLDDSIGFDRYLRGFARSAAPERVRLYRAQRALRWGPRDRVGEVFSSAVRGASAPTVSTIRALLVIGDNGAFYAPVPHPESTLELDDSADAVFESMRPSSPFLNAGNAYTRFQILIGLGRFRAAAAQLDTMLAAYPGFAGAVLPYVVSGLAPPSFVSRPQAAMDTLPPGPVVKYWKAVEALWKGEVGRARTLLDAPVSADSADGQALPQPFFGALRGWATIAEGDTVAGLASLRANLLATGYDPQYAPRRLPLLVMLARVQALQAGEREEGINRLSTLLHLDQSYQRSLELPLARALEEAGRTEEAKRAYVRFLAAWSGADASARPTVEGARQALHRLEGGG